MVASFFFMAAVAAWFWWRRWREGGVPTSRRLLWSVVLAAPFGMIALESGWLVTEFGRQPWIVHGVMRVESGVTPNAGMGAVFLTFIIVTLCSPWGCCRCFCGSRSAGRIPGGSP
jgi:cytochrome d ubiquinol oxidase subunit I